MGEWTAPGETGHDGLGRDGLGPLSGVDEPGEPLRFETTLRPRDFLGLSLKNGLLNIVTLTLWRFWGKTEVRRRVWRGVRMNGDAFEYTGRGVELFVGFLIALVVLGIPFLTLVFIGQGLLDPTLYFLILLPVYVFMFWLWGFGTFTAFRYMASRTTWRGIRFQLKGSAVSYGWRYLFYVILTAVTFGWFQPEAHRNLSEQTWDSLYLGTRRIRFRMERAHAKGVYGMYALGWFGQIGAYLVASILFFAVIMAAGLSGAFGDTDADTSNRSAYGAPVVAYQQQAEAPVASAPSPSAPSEPVVVVETPPPPVVLPIEAPYDYEAEAPLPTPEPPSIFLIIGVYAAMAVVAPIWMLIWAPYNAAILRSIVAGITIDRAGFKLDVKAMPLWWLTVTNLFFILITLGFLMPWAQARTVKFFAERLTSAGEVQIDKVEQTGTGPRTGEGLADAFGFSII